MKNIFTIPFTLITTLLVFGCASDSGMGKEKFASQPESVEPQERQIKNFEFLGCAGEWLDDGRTPEVWRTENEQSIQFIARHSDSCSYDVGLNPRATVIDGVLTLSYMPTNTSGNAAACLCEYWVKFELEVEPKGIKRVLLNGVAANLKGDLADR